MGNLNCSASPHTHEYVPPKPKTRSAGEIIRLEILAKQLHPPSEGLWGRKGLRALGFEFVDPEKLEAERSQISADTSIDAVDDAKERGFFSSTCPQKTLDGDKHVKAAEDPAKLCEHEEKVLTASPDSFAGNVNGGRSSNSERACENENHADVVYVPAAFDVHECENPRLMHIESGELITEDNLSKYIQSGFFYEEVARCAMEYVQDVMADVGDLVWTDIGEEKRKPEIQQPEVKKKKKEKYSLLGYSASTRKEKKPAPTHLPVVERCSKKPPVRALVSRFIAEGLVDEEKTSTMLHEEYNFDEEKKDDCMLQIVENNDGENDEELSNTNVLNEETAPVFVITTGRGKVRAGIFSRRLLMTIGMAPASALPLVQEARKRNMNVIIVDPNVHGERFGFDIFKRSWRWFFPSVSPTNESHEKPILDINMVESYKQNKAHRHFSAPVYVLAHSMAGSQLVRCLNEMTKDCKMNTCHFRERIKSIVFTDSTHNVQWIKGNVWLTEFVQSCETCVYFSSLISQFRSGILTSAGSEVETDQFWTHRMGNIKTLSAGTFDHSLTNYSARKEIWEHFERVLNKHPN